MRNNLYVEKAKSEGEQEESTINNTAKIEFFPRNIREIIQCPRRSVLNGMNSWNPFATSVCLYHNAK